MTTQPFVPASSLVLDHLTILSRAPEVAAKFYDLILPRLGFACLKQGIWRNSYGLYVQFLPAGEATRDYERYGPGLNHFGFRAPTPTFVEDVHTVVVAAGYEARLQRFPDGTVALFMPDPDGLRIELSWYPEGVPPVG